MQVDPLGVVVGETTTIAALGSVSRERAPDDLDGALVDDGIPETATTPAVAICAVATLGEATP